MTGGTGPAARTAPNVWALLGGRTMTSIAKRAGIPMCTVSNIFYGRRRYVLFGRGLALARALGVKPEVLLAALERARADYLSRERARIELEGLTARDGITVARVLRQT